MSTTCDIAVQEIGNGLAASLRGVDCMSSAMAQQAFGRLFGAEGQLVTALTILLTLFVAIFALALLTGRSRIGIASLTPRMITLGLVLTFATSWIAYQSVVWNLATGAPDEIAGIITGSSGSATQLFADKTDIVFAVIAEIASSQQGESATATFSPPNLLWLGAMLFLLGTVGVLVTTRIALAVLVALGPIFVVLALFGGTRGLFTGWLKGIVLLALAPMLAVISGSLMLDLTVPIINALQPMPGEIEPRAAFAFFMVGFVHVALMLLAIKTATAMVGGWRVFGLVPDQAERAAARIEQRSAAVLAAQNPQLAQAAAANTAASTARRADLGRVTAMVAANDAAAASPATTRETRIISQSAGAPPAAQGPGPSRTRGIGSRFRPAPSRKPESST